MTRSSAVLAPGIAVAALAAVIALLLTAVPAAPAVAAARAPAPFLVPITVVKGKVQGGTKRPSVKKGRLVRFVIRTDAGTEVHLHGYEIQRVPVKGKATVIQFTARLQGRFELELHSPDVLLAELTVR